MTKRIYASRSVRNPIEQFGRIVRLVGPDGKKRDELYQIFLEKKTRWPDRVKYSKKEFNAVLNEMRRYGLLDFEPRGEVISWGSKGADVSNLEELRRESDLRDLYVSSILQVNPQLLGFLERLEMLGAFMIPKPPGATEFREAGNRFTAMNASHRNNYVEYCLRRVHKTYNRTRKSLGYTLNSRQLEKLGEHMQRFSDRKVKERGGSINQRNVVESVEFAIKDFLIKKEFRSAFRSILEFDLWMDRLFFLGATNYSPSFPLLAAFLLYPTSTLAEPEKRKEYEKCVLEDGISIFIHRLAWASTREKFANILQRSYDKLSKSQDRSYVRIADLRDMVCFKLGINDSQFDEFMKKFYRESQQGKIPLRVSMDSDMLPGKDHWKRKPLDLGPVAGKRTIMCIL